MDVLQAIQDGKATVEWSKLLMEHAGHQLEISVFRDAMKFNGVPPLNFHRGELPNPKGILVDGVRLPVNAVEMQKVADLLYCMMLTPKVVDRLWVESAKSGVHFNSKVNIHGQVVAQSDILSVHAEIEEELAKHTDNGGIIDSVGKYWVVCNALLVGKFSAIKQQAVNYGWPDANNPLKNSVTMVCHMWQTIGSEHNTEHLDPSQVIRLMSRNARLLRAGSSTWEDVDLYDIAKDPVLCGLISHEGVMHTTRMPSVPEPQPVQNADGSITLPPVLILGTPPTPSV